MARAARRRRFVLDARPRPQRKAFRRTALRPGSGRVLAIRDDERVLVFEVKHRRFELDAPAQHPFQWSSWSRISGGWRIGRISESVDLIGLGIEHINAAHCATIMPSDESYIATVTKWTH